MTVTGTSDERHAGEALRNISRSLPHEGRLPQLLGCVQLSGAVQCVQAARQWHLDSGKSRSFRWHRFAVLPAGKLSLGNQTMSDLPTQVEIHEEGPREGFQIEPGPISTADKIRLIEALAETGLHHIQAASFVSPRIVRGWADAEDSRRRIHAERGRPLHGAVVQRERAQPGAGLPQQTD